MVNGGEEEEERFLQDKVILGKLHYNFVSRILSFLDFEFLDFEFSDFEFPVFE